MNFGHLRRLLGPHGLYEHALYRRPRPEHGYCTDDNARAVVITSQVDSADSEAILASTLGFVAAGHLPSGWRNRMAQDGTWLDGPGPEDSHGRAVWALGAALARDRLPLELFDMARDSVAVPLSALRANAYSLLGVTTAVMAGTDPWDSSTVRRYVDRLPSESSGRWRWPEPRLTYDNARIPMAMIRAGVVTEDDGLCARGVALLEWLVEVESRDSWFSFTPVAGRGPGERGPAFDQQPIEAWAMAEACEAAALAGGGQHWYDMARRAVAWFGGLNDVGVPLYDEATGAGYDGLERSGVNLNCGAESTLSALGSMLVGERMAAIRPGTAG